MAEVPVVLTIAGFDPSSGAGVTADLKTIAAHGLYGMACITSLTVQSTQGVRRSEPVSHQTVTDTLDYLAEDVEFAAIKIGMLANAEIVEGVATFLFSQGAARPPVVLDPVLSSSSGRELLSPPGVEHLREVLLKTVDWVTPNLQELAGLLGESAIERCQVEEAAARLQELGAGRLNVVVTGGHLDAPDDYLLTADGQGLWLRGDWVKTSSTHGTGCAFSSALACRVALGDGPNAAALVAKSYVAEGLRRAYPVGGRQGTTGHGPMHHLWPLI